MSEPLENVATLIHDLRMAMTKEEAWAIAQEYGRLAQT